MWHRLDFGGKCSTSKKSGHHIHNLSAGQGKEEQEELAFDIGFSGESGACSVKRLVFSLNGIFWIFKFEVL